MPEGEAQALDITGRLLDFAPDGKTLVTATGHSIQLWDWPAGKLRQTVNVKGEVLSGSVAPDSSVVVIGMSEANAIAVIDLKSGDTRRDRREFTGSHTRLASRRAAGPSAAPSERRRRKPSASPNSA